MTSVNTDANYYVKKTPKRCLHKVAKAKMKKYLEDCLQQLRNFLPFIVSVNGLLGVEA